VADDIVANYLERVSQREGGSVWSAERYTVAACRGAATSDAELARMFDAIAQAMEASPDSRFEQSGVPAAGHALKGRGRAMLAVMDGALELARASIDPGWFVQIVVPVLAEVDDDQLISAWHQLVAFARSLGAQFAGYPMGTGLAAMLQRREHAVLPRRLELLGQLARAAKRDAYGLFEYALTALARSGLDEGDFTDALQLAIAMFDHGIYPGSTLAALQSPLHLDLATRLAKAGVDPALVISNGMRVFDALGLLEDGGDRLVELATEMHRRGLRQLLFDDGLEIILPLEQDHGLGIACIELIEHMVAAGIEPAYVMRWHLGRTLGQLREPWAAAELLAFADALVEHGVTPDAAVGYAGRSLVELARDVEAFRRNAAAVVALVAKLRSFGVDYHEVLFGGVAKLADAGGESHSFGELLEAMGELLAAWSHDPTELLKTALPAAARESTGRPWVLAIALRSATRLAREHRFAEAESLLSVGVRTASGLGLDGEGFAEALTAVEARYAALPSELLSHASLAAGTLAGTDVEKLDAALAAIGEAATHHGAAFHAIASALPDLARIANDPIVLGELIDAMLPAGERAARLAALALRFTPAEARVLWRELAEASPRALDRFGALPHLRVAPAAIPALVALVDRAYADVKDARPLHQLLEHAKDEPSVRQICELVPPLLATEGPIVDGLYRARDLVGRSAHAWTYLVAPALVTAKQHATPLIRVLAHLPVRSLVAEDDCAVIRELITQRGLRAVDLLATLIAPALSRNVITSLHEHRDRLERYLRLVGFADVDVYARYLECADNPAKVAALRDEIAELVNAIRAGEVSAPLREHALFGVALQHVFPASVSATRQAWLRLVETMPDRQADLAAFARPAPLSLATGDWELADTSDLECFAWAGRVLPAEEHAAPEPSELGFHILTAWSEGRLAREPARTELTRSLLSLTEQLPAAAYDSASQLRAIHALAGDQLAQLVEQVVIAARDTDPERAERLVRTRLAPAPRIGPGLVKAIQRTLASDDPNAILAKQLAAFELPADPAAHLRAAGDLLAALAALPARPIEIAPGKELARIHADLVGQELAAMTAALARALVYREAAGSLTVELELTKRDVHAPIGLTAGVCVATDVELWNTPGFGHLALWDGGICAGSMHLLVVEEDARYLVLPGINPTLALLERTSAEPLVRALLAAARELARSAGLAGVWIPTSPSIHSNRRAVHDVLAAMSLPVRRTRGHAFSVSPYAYRVDDVWVA
jgi:hypothetical protein